MSAGGDSSSANADQLAGDLAAAHSQLARYAHDLREMLQRERTKSKQLEAAHLDTLMRLTRAAAWKDAETGAHLERLAIYSQLMAREVGLSEEASKRIATAAPLHDIGKIGIPEAVLVKPSPLTQDEWTIMKRHPGIGASLLKDSSSPLIETARVIALTHHENWDGSGYPGGRLGDQTPIEGRIVMLVDRYDALRSKRYYKPALDHDTTCGLILEGNGRIQRSQFDPTLLDVFAAIHGEFDAIYARSGE